MCHPSGACSWRHRSRMEICPSAIPVRLETDAFKPVSMYLVDTNVISAGTPQRGAVQASRSLWMDQRSERLALSAITIAEIEDGIAKARRAGATKKSEALARWLEV